jgi:hypothetical protein
MKVEILLNRPGDLALMRLLSALMEQHREIEPALIERAVAVLRVEYADVLDHREAVAAMRTEALKDP